MLGHPREPPPPGPWQRSRAFPQDCLYQQPSALQTRSQGQRHPAWMAPTSYQDWLSCATQLALPMLSLGTLLFLCRQVPLNPPLAVSPQAYALTCSWTAFSHHFFLNINMKISPSCLTVSMMVLAICSPTHGIIVIVIFCLHRCS